MLNAAACEGTISYHPRCKCLLITHLYFADDLLVFTSVISSSLLGIKSILEKFYYVSGLGVSYGKSELFCC